jgi:hypothetical protein
VIRAAAAADEVGGAGLRTVRSSSARLVVGVAAPAAEKAVGQGIRAVLSVVSLME